MQNKAALPIHYCITMQGEKEHYQASSSVNKSLMQLLMQLD